MQGHCDIDPDHAEHPPGKTIEVTDPSGLYDTGVEAPIPSTQPSPVDHPSQPCSPDPQKSRPTRAKRLPTRFNDYVLGFISPVTFV